MYLNKKCVDLSNNRKWKKVKEGVCTKLNIAVQSREHGMASTVKEWQDNKE
jgi:hypothetical protein